MGRVQVGPQPPTGGLLQQCPQRGPPVTAPPGGAGYNSALGIGLPTTVPSERACYNSAPLQGGILKPPALRVVVDWGATNMKREACKLPALCFPLPGECVVC